MKVAGQTTACTGKVNSSGRRAPPRATRTRDNGNTGRGMVRVSTPTRVGTSTWAAGGMILWTGRGNTSVLCRCRWVEREARSSHHSLRTKCRSRCPRPYPHTYPNLPPMKVTQHAIGGGLPQIGSRNDASATQTTSSSDVHLPPIDAH